MEASGEGKPLSTGECQCQAACARIPASGLQLLLEGSLWDEKHLACGGPAFELALSLGGFREGELVLDAELELP